MSSTIRPAVDIVRPSRSSTPALKNYINHEIEELLATLPDAAQLSASARRGMIARYTAVLEGNFIYWMTATYLSVASDEAKTIIEDNLREEVRDNHPGMLRRFTVAARGRSTDADRAIVDKNIQAVRAFVGKMSPLKIVLMMAFFEGFIQRFMPYLADLAERQGSQEKEYTDVHGVVDIGHTQELYRAFDAEEAITKDVPSDQELLEGVAVLRTLVETIIDPETVRQQQPA
jgi:hypothetical protein